MKNHRMTKRQRLINTFNRLKTDRIPWTTFIDEKTIIPGYSEKFKVVDAIKFYKYINCEILMLNAWGTQLSFDMPRHVFDKRIHCKETIEGRKRIKEWETKSGKLIQVNKDDHPVKYPVENIEDIKIYIDIWEKSSFVGNSDATVKKKIDKIIGSNGIVTRFWGPSAVPLLLENIMGIQNFYLLLNDYKNIMEKLINTIHEKQMQAFNILSKSVCDVIILIENTSTFYISPDIYRKYNMPHQRDFVNVIKNGNKVAILHMCGHIKKILDIIKETECDGIHALNEPPTGDCFFEDALNILGDDLIIAGSTIGCDSLAYGKPEDIKRHLDNRITSRVKNSNFILVAGADGMYVPLKNFLAVRDWVRENG